MSNKSALFKVVRLFVVVIITLIPLCRTKIQYLENGANYVRICCDFRTIEAYEVTYDERRRDVVITSSLNQTPMVNVSMETFAYSNIHAGNIIPLIPRYNFTLYHWYLLCFNTEIEQTCIFVRPCDCACDKTAWLTYNVTITAEPPPSQDYVLNVTSQFSSTIFPLPVALTYSWFASDYDAITMCKTGEISPERCDFMLTDTIVVNTSGTTTTYAKSSVIQLDTDHLYFSLSLIMEPRWLKKLPTTDVSTFDPQVMEIFRNDTRTVYFRQCTAWQVSEERLSGRLPSSAEEKSRLCTAVGSLIAADQLKEGDRTEERLKEMHNGNNIGIKPMINMHVNLLTTCICVIYLLLLF